MQKNKIKINSHNFPLPFKINEKYFIKNFNNKFTSTFYIKKKKIHESHDLMADFLI